MKKLLAMLLAGCMLAQSLSGAAVTALGAEPDMAVVEDSGGSGSGGTAALDTAGGSEMIEIVPEGSSSAAEMNVSGEDASNPPSEESAGGESDGAVSDVIIEEVSSDGGNGGSDGLEETDAGESETGEADLMTISGNEIITSESEQTPAASQSYIEVRVSYGQSFIPKEGLLVEVSVYKEGKDTPERQEKKLLEKLGDAKEFVFSVEPGDYRVTVNAAGYAQYEHKLQVGANKRKKIFVDTAKTVPTTDAVIGWMRLGNVAEGGEIDKADIDEILSQIRSGVTGDDATADLTKGLNDNKVDIADLQIAVQNMNAKGQTSTVEEQQVPLPPTIEEGTTIKNESGEKVTLDDLIKGTENPITLQKEKEITPENPVTIAYPFAKDENGKLPELDGIVIQAPVEENSSAKSGISSGLVEIEAVDENGNDVIYQLQMPEEDSAKETQNIQAADPGAVMNVPSAASAQDDENPDSTVTILDEPVPGAETAEIVDVETIGDTAGMTADTSLLSDADEVVLGDASAAPVSDDTGANENENQDLDIEIITSIDTVPQPVGNPVVSVPESENTVVSDDLPETDSQLTDNAETDPSETDSQLTDNAEMDPSETDSQLTGSEETDPAETDSQPADSETSDLPEMNSQPADNALTALNEEDLQSVDNDGLNEDVPQPIDEPEQKKIIKLDNGSAKISGDGSIVMDFGKQVAVKKVTIKITGSTKKEQNLVDISKVEFVNGMDKRIPEPVMNIPKLELKPGNEEITVTWKEEQNVTGYELWISGVVKKAGQQEQTVSVSGTTHTFTGINNNDLMNFKEYQIKARSVNGEWRSDWSKIQTEIPKPSAPPEPVDNLKIKGGYRSLSLSWKDMDDANGYMVFYRADSEKDYQPAIAGFELESENSGEDRIQTNSYTLTDLEDNTLYWVYVIGWNELGWGSYTEERIVSEKTESIDHPQLPKYHAINLPETDDENTIGKLTPHIKSADCSWYDANPNNNSEEKDKGKQPRMVNSQIDGCVAEEGDTTPKKTNSAKGVVDNDYESYWQKYDWDEGYVYGGYGVKVTLDAAYDIGYLTYSAYNIEKELAGGYVERAKIYYRDTTADENAKEQVVPAYVYQKRDVNQQLYYVVMFQKAVKANEIRLCIGRGYGDIWMRIGEMRFHECDDLYKGIMGLFADDEMHSSLRSEPEVTEEELERLDTELETPDENGEKHPLYDSLRLELDLAKKMFEDREKAQKVLKVDTRLTTNSDSHLKFGGLNAWQPLGKVAAQGETMIFYVGHDAKWAGEASNLQVVFTQYHAQSNELNSTINLKIGRNEVTAPGLTKENRERGGQVYIQYTGTRGSDEKYEVRALGGQDIPVLSVYKMKKGEAKTAAIETYVRELDKYVKTIQTTHDSLLPTKDADGKSTDATWKNNINQAYTDRNCLLNATDLMMDYMMYSVPALQVWKGITNNADVNTSLSDAEVTAAAKRLETSLNAMEDTMKLFYQHKGLSDDPKAVSSEERGNNEMPVKHLNIRYMQMFKGAFMYASGNHIGIEYPETNVAGGAGSWDSFGWGIAHEIGHDINQSWYAIAEITNNYFAQLLTKAYNGTRFQYEIDPNDKKAGDPANDIYSKVTSGTLGRSANGAVQLGLYWQLHLAFDNYTIDNQGKNNTLNETVKKSNYTDDRYVFDNYEDQFDNLFFARVDTYGRNPSKAPHGGVTLASGAAAVDQNLMRLSCAAAEANILPFFERWGMVPDEGTLAYAAAFGEATTKALYYVNDDARDYRAAHPGEPDNILNKDVIESATVSADGGKVSITVTPKADAKGEVLLGYEIIRGMYSNGKLKEDVVGFKLAKGNEAVTYIDEIATINNRVMYYKVKAVDQYLNYSNVKDAADSVKIQTNGALPKSEWTIETTMTSADDVMLNPNPSFAVEPEEYKDNGKDDPDGGFDSNLQTVKDNAKKVEHSIDRIADRDENSTYIGTDGTNASITIDLHDFCEVTSLIYRGEDLGEVTVSVSTDNANWTQVKKASIMDENLVSQNADGSKTIWFDSVSDDPAIRAAWIGTYQARYVKLEFNKAGTVKINEIDICGPTGDNLEFEKADGEDPTTDQNVIGVLKGDYTYSNGADNKPGTEDDDIIPAGSLIFTGRYKGNPAYNVVILYDKNGNVIGAHKNKDGTVGVDAEQVIFAKVPAKGNLGETSDGIWVYYLKPEVWKDEATWKATVEGGKIRGELYRVDNALTNDGERIVSDTKLIDLPESLPEITITGGEIPESGAQQ